MNTNTGSVPDKSRLRQIKKQLHNAASFVRSREQTEALLNTTFNERIQGHITELVGDDSANLRQTVKEFVGGREVEINVVRARIHGRVVRTKLDRITALENTIDRLIEGVRKIDPEALLKQIEDQESRNIER
jgi:hypothetical protein